MELVRFEPFAGFGNLRSVFNGLFDENLGRSSTQPSVSKWYPAVDVLESKDSYLIRAELPGMKREDIKVEVKDGTLVLSGERKFEKPADGVEYRHVGHRKVLAFILAARDRETGWHRGHVQRRHPGDTRAEGGRGQTPADRNKRALIGCQITRKKGRQIASLFSPELVTHHFGA